MKLCAFGRDLDIQRRDGAWVAFDLGSEGKRREARDIIIPSAVPEEELIGYISDLLHEYATSRHPEVVRLG
ncbi:MAG: hypothetical protein Cons2KO_34240 [Congregibacter sp.]